MAHGSARECERTHTCTLTLVCAPPLEDGKPFLSPKVEANTLPGGYTKPKGAIAGLEHEIRGFVFILVGVWDLEKGGENPALRFSERRACSMAALLGVTQPLLLLAAGHWLLPWVLRHIQSG